MREMTTLMIPTEVASKIETEAAESAWLDLDHAGIPEARCEEIADAIRLAVSTALAPFTESPRISL